MRNRKPMLLAVALGVLGLAVLLAGPGVLRREPPPPAPSAGSATAGASGRTSATGSASPAGSGIPQLDEQVAYLRSQYGVTIRSPYTQVMVLERLIGQLRGKSELWEDELLAILRKAFPEEYAQLAANLRHWLDYERWYKENEARLRTLPDDQRRAELWAERERLYGKEQAREIWAGELKGQAFEDAVRALDTPNTSLSDKLAQYKETLGDTYQEHTDEVMEGHRQELLNRFFDMSSVQQELSAMTPEQRSASLREIRKGLGLDDEALARWDALDQTRDARWAAGAQYMKEREALAGQLSGPELEEKLNALRERYFGPEAGSVAQEEASGFFRFNRTRKWGRN